MNVLLLNLNHWGRSFTPIGLAMVSSVLKERGHSTKLFDTTFYNFNTINEQKEGEKYLSYKQTDLSNYSVKFDKTDEVADFKQILSDYKPDLIIFSVFSSHLNSEGEYNMYYYGRELIKKSGKNIPVLVGGIIPTSIPEKVIHDGVTDIICLGECEEAIGELADKMEMDGDITNIKNIWVKKGDKVYKNGVRPLINDLDKLPYMDLSIFDDKSFYRPFKGRVYRAIDTEISRGCIYCCDYCVESIMQKLYGYKRSQNGGVIKGKGYHREKSVNRIIQEYIFLRDSFNIEFLRFQDTNFLSISEKKLIELSERFSGQVGLPFYIETRPEGITKKRASLLKKMGCVGAGMGLEVGNYSYRKGTLNRNCNNQAIIRACNNLRELGMRATTYNIIGFPGETREDIMKTIELNRMAKPESMTIAFYSPYIGTPMYGTSIKKGVIPDKIICLDQKLYTQVRQSQDSLSPRELLSLRNTFIMYVLSSKILWPLVRLAERDNLVGRAIYRMFQIFLKR